MCFYRSVFHLFNMLCLLLLPPFSLSVMYAGVCVCVCVDRHGVLLTSVDAWRPEVMLGVLLYAFHSVSCVVER